MGQGSDRFRTELRTLIPRLRRFGHALTGSIENGDDLLQDALEKALSRESQFELGTRLDSWMFRIMQTTWIDQKRADNRRSRITGPLEDGALAVGEDGRRTFNSRIELARVREMMARLQPNECAVLSLVSIEGLTYREAADVLAIPIGTVMSRLYYARQKLRALLEKGTKTQ